MASGVARTVKITHRRTGTVYWAEKRVGYNGIEYNFGAGWRKSPGAAFAAAREAGQLSKAPPGNPSD